MIVHHKWIKFDDQCYQINLLSVINLLLLVIKFSFICEGKPCRVCIKIYHAQSITKAQVKCSTNVLSAPKAKGEAEEV